jgi:hypothetical protein
LILIEPAPGEIEMELTNGKLAGFPGTDAADGCGNAIRYLREGERRLKDFVCGGCRRTGTPGL